MSSNAGATASYFCHECQQSIQPLMQPGPTCPRCNGQFVEELGSVQASAATGDDGDDFEDGPLAGIHNFFGGAAGVRNGAPYGHDADAAPQFDLGGLLRGVLGNLANAGNEPSHSDRSGQASNNTGAGSSRSSQASGSGGSNMRGGSGSFGPVNYRWGYSTQADGGTRSSFGMRTGNATGRSANPNAPPSLSDFLRGSFPQGHPNDDDGHVHDDGMGGAGGASDGRFFNHDNPHNVRDGSDSEEEEEPANVRPQQTDLPPELATLRQVFSNLFGGMGDGPAGQLVNMLGDNLLNGRSGDYVFGQQGLDDVITQLMDQTRGSTAPPAASADTIAKLKRFSRKDVDKVRQARNRECSTCMDSFEDEEHGKTDASLDSNLPVEDADDVEDHPIELDDVEDDPPELMPDSNDQQDELVMMPCRHLFHEDCLVPWLKTSGTCPVCRVRLDGVPEHPSATAVASTSASAVASAAGTETPLRSPSLATISELPSTAEDLDSETPEQRRSRMGFAAEARARHAQLHAQNMRQASELHNAHLQSHAEMTRAAFGNTRNGQDPSQDRMPGSFDQPPPLDDID